MTCSLTQSVRITNAKEFAHVFKKGQHCQSQFWKLVANNSGHSFARLGLAISKNDYKRAVDRNHLKRLVRETFRKNQSVLSHLDFVVMAKTMHTNNREVTLDLLSLMKKAKKKAIS